MTILAIMVGKVMMTTYDDPLDFWSAVPYVQTTPTSFMKVSPGQAPISKAQIDAGDEVVHIDDRLAGIGEPTG
jgi:hypothetical protein